ncbi:hypothetical protein B0J11DRAFT_574805 [Dendryphion nanum]|uniref:Mg2+ transporter protein, CorA-like/Zinc transport protein ZntB n=1 Tax=Dendryphion nanum TaxID=256645 RepID=A0A9P9J1M7_9PLEO|nr:hypothetical protein B0J11DRAFT_574805 [Dendryphion nanum]
MSEVEVLEGNQIRASTWQIEIESGKVTQTAPNTSRILFGSSKGLKSSIERISSDPNLPAEFISAITKDLNGFFGNRRNEGWEELWYTFKIKQVEHKRTPLLYHWDQVTAFSRWDAPSDKGILLCLDCPQSARESLKERWRTGNLSLLRWHVDFLEKTRDLYEDSVWSLRHCVRKSETDSKNIQDFTPDFVLLNETARHLTHSNETIDVAIDLMEGIRDVLKENSTSVEARNADNKIRALQMEVKALGRRSLSLYERLQNEITLAFNIVTQRESRVMVELGAISRKDSTNMRSIAVVGLLYLPGTFISGLFGMNFFDFDASAEKESWRVSDKFWLYWAITIPVTALTVMIWVVFFHAKALKRIFGRLFLDESHMDGKEC